MKIASRLLASCAVVAVMAPHPAKAQPAAAPLAAAPQAQSPAVDSPVAAPAKADDTNTVADVVVTATRDPSRESKTPVAMQVYSAQTLAEKGIANVQSLANADSSLNISSGGGQPFIALRGVSTSDTSEVGDPGVPVSIDNLFTNRSYALNTGFFDVNRVEILRGPQGTLFGRNAIGGVVNIYSNDPEKRFGGYGEVEVGDYGRINSTGAINLPITDTLQVRVAFQTRDHDGYRSNGDGGRGDDEGVDAGRVKIAWQPLSHLKLGFQYQHTDADQTGTTSELIPFKANQVVNPQNPGGPLLNILDRTVTYGGDGRSFPLQYKSVEELRQDTVHWNAAYELGDGMTVSYIGGYDRLHRLRVTPQSSVAANPFGFANAGFVQNESAQTLNQELRLSSAQGGRLTWQVGSFYFHEDGAVDTNLFFNYLTPTQARFLNFNYPSVTAESLAGYGQASYAITDTVKFTAGVRYTEDNKKKSDGFDTLDLKAFAPFLPTLVTPSSGSSHSGVWTYHFGVDWQATPTSLVYAKTDKGYKAGGYNSGNAVPYSPEILYAYEIGAKNRFFSNHLTLNADVFYQLYQNQQVFESVDPLNPANNGATALVENVGSSPIKGVELGLVAVSDKLGRLDLNAAFVHARFANYITKDQALDGGSLPDQQLKGKTLPNSPDVSITGGYEHSFSIFGGALVPRIETKFQSAKYFTAYNTPDGKQGPNFITNAYLRYTPEGSRYNFEIYIRNLTNEAVLTDFTEQKDTKVYAYGFVPPRTYGARLRVNF